MTREGSGSKVDVLLSLYDPDPRFLEAQLASVRDQDWPDLEVLVYDDCPDRPADRDMVRRSLAPVPVRFLPPAAENVGYVAAFERLVRASDGDYVAFCDQDDVWAPGKVSALVRAIERDGSLLAVCDYDIIDGEGNLLEPSARRPGSSRFFDTWQTGSDVVAHDIFQCLAPGMVQVLDGDFARSIVPFSRNTGHDKWAIACAGIEGTVSYVPEVLASYRRHGSNVTGALSGVDPKEGYRVKRCAAHDALIGELEARYGAFDGLAEAREFSRARMAGDVAGIWRHRSLAPDQALFEVVLALVPSWAFGAMKAVVRRAST